MSVLLPAPFSPSRAPIVARAQVEINLVVGDDAGESLDDAARLELRGAGTSGDVTEAAPRRGVVGACGRHPQAPDGLAS